MNAASRTTLALLLGLVSAGCEKGSEEDPPPAFAGGCRILAAEPIDAHAEPLGWSADEAASLAPVRAGYQLLYGDGPGAPASELEVGIEAIDESRIFFVRQSVGLLGDVEIPCPPAITFPAVVRFRSADGAFDEALQVDVLATGVAEHEWHSYVPLGSLHGAFRPADERGWSHRGLSFAARFDNGSAVGGVSLTSEGSGGTRVATVGYWGIDTAF